MLFSLLFSLQELLFTLVRWDVSLALCCTLQQGLSLQKVSPAPLFPACCPPEIWVQSKRAERTGSGFGGCLSLVASWLWRGWVSVKQERSSAGTCRLGWRDGKPQLTASECLSQLRQKKVWWTAMFCHLLRFMCMSRAGALLIKARTSVTFPIPTPSIFLVVFSVVFIFDPASSQIRGETLKKNYFQIRESPNCLIFWKK